MSILNNNILQSELYKKRPGGASFARRVGKGFNQSHRAFLDNHHSYILPCEIKADNEYILEIGSGDGHNAINLCQFYPDKIIIAAEVFLSGVIQHIKKAINSNIVNLKIFPDDVNLLLLKLLNQQLDQIYILFPDPWPKNKQHKRRLVQNHFIEALLPKLKDQGSIVIATDHLEYAKWIDKHLAQVKNIQFYKTDKAPEHYSPTKYHTKDLAGHNYVNWFYVNKL